MSGVIDLEDGRIHVAVKKGFKNWKTQFNEAFDEVTKLSDISSKTLAYLSAGKDENAFYMYDLIMNLKGMGSGFEFYEMGPGEKMSVIDVYLFLLDRARFECMKRLGWLSDYPGEEFSLVELITRFHTIGPNLQAKVPGLNENHPSYSDYMAMNTLDRDSFIRKMIPAALKEFRS